MTRLFFHYLEEKVVSVHFHSDPMHQTDELLQSVGVMEILVVTEQGHKIMDDLIVSKVL